MSVGTSGRIVLEVDPALKRDLYAVLARDGQTLKAWFVERAEEYLRTYVQPSFRFQAEPRAGSFARQEKAST